MAAGNRTYFGIETDVHVTGDGEYLIIHDDTTARVAIDNLRVEESTFETLRSLRLRDTDGKRGRADLRLPSLREYVGVCRKYGKISVLELKNHMEPEHVDRIIGIVREEGWLENTIFISFDLENLIRVRERLPEQKAQFLVEKGFDWEETIAALKKYRLGLDIQFILLTEERLKQLHGLGAEVNVWTVNQPEDGERLARWGVDYITTNILE